MTNKRPQRPIDPRLPPCPKRTCTVWPLFRMCKLRKTFQFATTNEGRPPGYVSAPHTSIGDPWEPLHVPLQPLGPSVEHRSYDQ